LTPDDVTFDPSADLKSGNEIIDLDISHLYHGYVIGKTTFQITSEAYTQFRVSKLFF